MTTLSPNMRAALLLFAEAKGPRSPEKLGVSLLTIKGLLTRGLITPRRRKGASYSTPHRVPYALTVAGRGAAQAARAAAWRLVPEGQNAREGVR